MSAPLIPKERSTISPGDCLHYRKPNPWIVFVTALFVFSLSGGLFIYRWSTERTSAEVEAARYAPPPKKPLSQVLTERQLAKHRRQLDPPLSAPPTHDPAKNEERAVAELTTGDKEPEEDEEHKDVGAASTDPFGNPLNPDGTPVGGDPCKGHHRPEGGFKGPEWLRLCEENDVQFADCERFLEFSWAVGDGSITPSFEAPPGCLP